jgi:hypothetical protein
VDGRNGGTGWGSSPASLGINSRKPMAKSKIRVRRLTLPPTSAVGVAESSDQQDDGDDESRAILDKEQMASHRHLAISWLWNPPKTSCSWRRTYVGIEVLGVW